MTSVYYAGTETEWRRILVKEKNDPLWEAELITEISYLTGDANGDDSVGFADIQRIYQHLSTQNNKLTGMALTAADANKDGNVNFADIQRIYQHLSTDNKLF